MFKWGILRVREDDYRVMFSCSTTRWRYLSAGLYNPPLPWAYSFNECFICASVVLHIITVFHYHENTWNDEEGFWNGGLGMEEKERGETCVKSSGAAFIRSKEIGRYSVAATTVGQMDRNCKRTFCNQLTAQTSVALVLIAYISDTCLYKRKTSQ